ncbi:uncharacterized protein PV06_09931 [Exophiala oligosperma]|uniref:Uncharacterized protein n=1 Tax=Exophiala oligosperma TaxID=215243 RepID=A0A0D2D3X0_9EURO|nr:uncharacterized protein PV06_09931 [Exophiala oligosperma]KIW37953.1 hypothetical protein PV06_09931 [Exophiala oligosperma]
MIRMVQAQLPPAIPRRVLRSIARRSTVDFFYSKLPRSRSFAHKPSLLLVARPIPRPQLPFLHPATRVNIVQAHVGRFISTERKQRWKAQLWRQLRFHAYLWPSVFLVTIIMIGIQQTKFERDFPTPRDWSFWSRWLLRNAKFTELSEGAKVSQVMTDWAKAGRYYLGVLERLESEDYDGKFLLASEATGTYADSLGIVGFDVSAKSDQWRRGYHDALMGAGRAAENLDGMCRRKDDPAGRVYSRESIPGPDNPRPKPLPWDKKRGHETPPTQDEVEDAFPSPEVFYMKILTTEGFNTRQRLDAAMAYADWCDFKGLAETAEDTYSWAMDIAQAGFAGGPADIIDTKTGMIARGREDEVSENVLRVCTAYAVHHARAGNVKQALPIFLSVLRARKNLPPSPFGVIGRKRPAPQDQGLWPYISSLKDLIIERPFPEAPPSGNNRPYHTLKEACEEVGLMTYIGEILFATSDSEREKGLSWTRDSVEAAEAVLWVMEEKKEDDGRERCRECLETGLTNWKEMSRQMARLAARKAQEAEKGSGWLGLGIGKSQRIAEAQREKARWEEENVQIQLRKEKTLPLTQPIKPPPQGWF